MKDLWQLVVFIGLAAVLFVPLIVSDNMFFPFITGKNFGFRIIVEITLAAWILLALYEPAYRPRFSWLLPSAAALLVIMFFANVFGEHVTKSFWSNYERMDGYVTLVHFVAYFVVLGSVLSNRAITFFGIPTTSWYVFMATALIAALWVCFTAFQQLSGAVETTMGWRINGTLGNASYMAIYMLFNVFIAAWVLLHSKKTWVRVLCMALIALFVFLLIQTATRGTILGLLGGTFLGSLYVALFNTQFPRVRKVAAGILVAVVLITSALFLFKDTAFVEDNTLLRRATNINLQALDLRIDIWAVSLAGIAERPLLGWGQGNFNYIFNQNYDPTFAGRAEQWYDRGHNIFIDWLSAGGVLGLAAYLSLWSALAFYLLIQPHKRDEEPLFTVTERGLLIGILAGYFIHNLVVFDNIVSYIFFAILLALVHSRVSQSSQFWPQRTFDPAVITNVITPVVIVCTIGLVYAVNIPGMRAAQDIIDAYRSNSPEARLEAFQQAFARDAFANQEVTEQFVQQAITIAGNQAIAEETRLQYLREAEQRLLDLAAQKPGDARIHVFMTSFYRTVGNIEKAREQNDLALTYSPDKPAIILERGIIEYQARDFEAMLNYFKQAYNLSPNFSNAQVNYAAGLILTGASESKWRAVLTDPEAQEEFLFDQLVLTAADQTQNFDLLEELFMARIDRRPSNPQHRVNLAYTQYRADKSTEAISTLESAAQDLPEVATVAECFIENIRAGNNMQAGC